MLPCYISLYICRFVVSSRLSPSCYDLHVKRKYSCRLLLLLRRCLYGLHSNQYYLCPALHEHTLYASHIYINISIGLTLGVALRFSFFIVYSHRERTVETDCVLACVQLRTMPIVVVTVIIVFTKQL